MRLVIDSNVVVDAIFGAGIPGREEHARQAQQLISAIEQRRWGWVCSDDILDEYLYVVAFQAAPAKRSLALLVPPTRSLNLHQIQGLHPRLREALITLYRLVIPHTVSVDTSQPLPPNVPVPPDDTDVIFVEAAYFADAHYIVTRDGHLNGIDQLTTRSGNICVVRSPWQVLFEQATLRVRRRY